MAHERRCGARRDAIIYKGVQEAYDTLGDEQKRAAYDQYGPAGANGFNGGAGGFGGFDGAGGFGGFEDIFFASLTTSPWQETTVMFG